MKTNNKNRTYDIFGSQFSFKEKSFEVYIISPTLQTGKQRPIQLKVA